MADRKIAEKAPAKINLDLLVTGRRDDGYHELDSIVVFAKPADRLAITPSDKWSFDYSGPFADLLPDKQDNIVYKAAVRLADAAGNVSPARIRLEKNLPIAGGIGGGSSDAAAVLRGLRRLWSAPISDEGLRTIGLSLGADLPVCIFGRPARMRGIGERLDPVRGLPDLPLLLVNPGFGVSTADVFKTLQIPEDTFSRPQLPIGASLVQFALWLKGTRNDLEAAARTVEPRIDRVLEALSVMDDVIVSRMSGSGATCFGLFRTIAAAKKAEKTLQTAAPHWWVAATEVTQNRQGAEKNQ